MTLQQPLSPDDPEYLRLLDAEASFWSRPQSFSVDAWDSAPLGPLKRHFNQRFTGDERTPWYDTIHQHGAFQIGLLLGCGGLMQETHILETNLGMHLTMFDIDRAGLARRDAEFGRRFPGRTTTDRVDLNFVDLEPERYDVIISSSTFHHLLNVERVAAQIAKALKPDGLFFLHDYVGPTRFQFPPQQKAVFEILWRSAVARGELDPHFAITWPPADGSGYSPFEAVRSEETLGIVERELQPLEVRTGGSVAALLLFSGVAAYTPGARTTLRNLLRRPARPDALALIWERVLPRRFISDLIRVDDLVSDAALLPPINVFARYRRRR